MAALPGLVPRGRPRLTGAQLCVIDEDDAAGSPRSLDGQLVCEVSAAQCKACGAVERSSSEERQRAAVRQPDVWRTGASPLNLVHRHPHVWATEWPTVFTGHGSDGPLDWVPPTGAGGVQCSRCRRLAGILRIRILAKSHSAREPSRARRQAGGTQPPDPAPHASWHAGADRGQHRRAHVVADVWLDLPVLKMHPSVVQLPPGRERLPRTVERGTHLHVWGAGHPVSYLLPLHLSHSVWTGSYTLFDAAAERMRRLGSAQPSPPGPAPPPAQPAAPAAKGRHHRWRSTAAAPRDGSLPRQPDEGGEYSHSRGTSGWNTPAQTPSTSVPATPERPAAPPAGPHAPRPPAARGTLLSSIGSMLTWPAHRAEEAAKRAAAEAAAAAASRRTSTDPAAGTGFRALRELCLVRQSVAEANLRAVQMAGKVRRRMAAMERQVALRRRQAAARDRRLKVRAELTAARADVDRLEHLLSDQGREAASTPVRRRSSASGPDALEIERMQSRLQGAVVALHEDGAGQERRARATVARTRVLLLCDLALALRIGPMPIEKDQASSSQCLDDLERSWWAGLPPMAAAGGRPQRPPTTSLAVSGIDLQGLLTSKDGESFAGEADADSKAQLTSGLWLLALGVTQAASLLSTPLLHPVRLAPGVAIICAGDSVAANPGPGPSAQAPRQPTSTPPPTAPGSLQAGLSLLSGALGGIGAPESEAPESSSPGPVPPATLAYFPSPEDERAPPQATLGELVLAAPDTAHQRDALVRGLALLDENVQLLLRVAGAGKPCEPGLAYAALANLHRLFLAAARPLQRQRRAEEAKGLPASVRTAKSAGAGPPLRPGGSARQWGGTLQYNPNAKVRRDYGGVPAGRAGGAGSGAGSGSGKEAAWVKRALSGRA